MIPHNDLEYIDNRLTEHAVHLGIDDCPMGFSFIVHRCELCTGFYICSFGYKPNIMECEPPYRCRKHEKQ